MQKYIKSRPNLYSETNQVLGHRVRQIKPSHAMCDGDGLD
jgi:hypothetical protein